MTVYQCEDTLEGIFTCIYRAYEEKRDCSNTVISLTDELLLFAEYVPAAADEEKARRVAETLRKRFGEEDYMRVCLALASDDTQKASAVYRTVAAGISGRCGKGRLFDRLSDPWVNKAFALSRAVGNEVHHLKGFLRFQELEGGALFSSIGPKNDVMTFLMPHFAERFPMENFMIFDENRYCFGIHPAAGGWYLARKNELRDLAFSKEKLRMSAKEKEYQELFRYFCHKIAIKERENKALQKKLLPLRFQEYMVEFQESATK